MFLYHSPYLRAFVQGDFSSATPSHLKNHGQLINDLDVNLEFTVNIPSVGNTKRAIYKPIKYPDYCQKQD